MKVSFSNHSTTGTFILTCGCIDGRLFYYTKQKGSDRGTKTILNRLQTAVIELEERCKVLDEPFSKQAVRACLDKILHKDISAINTLEKLTRVVEKIKAGEILTPGNKQYTKGSVKSLNFTITLLKRFNLPDHITMDTHSKFIKWCQAEKFSNSYIGSQLKNIKSLCRIAGIALPPDFKRINEDPHDIYLTRDELKMMAQAKLTKRETLVRDWFLIGCNTGLRVSDLLNLTEKNIVDGKIEVLNKKTGTKVSVPINSTIREIRDKYNGFPPKITDVELNREIKIVAEKSEIKGKIQYTNTIGGKRKDHYVEKHLMVTSHTCRRSFITNLIKAGVSEPFVMAMAGIKSHVTLKRYNKTTVEEVSNIMEGHEFFK